MVREDLEPKIVEVLSQIFGERFYPEVAPQKPVPSYPFGIYQLTGERLYKSVNCEPQTEVSIQIDIYALTVDLRRSLVKQVRDKMAEIGGKFSALRQMTFEKEIRTHRASLDFEFIF